MAAWESQLHPRRGPGNICRQGPSRVRTGPACHPRSLAQAPTGSVFRPASAESQGWDSAAIAQTVEQTWREGRRNRKSIEKWAYWPPLGTSLHATPKIRTKFERQGFQLRISVIGGVVDSTG